MTQCDPAGKYAERDMPDYSGRDWKERTFTVGIGGPVGSGKTALLLALCRALRDDYNIGEYLRAAFLAGMNAPIGRPR